MTVTENSSGGAWDYVRNGVVGTLTLNRPPVNALTFEDWRLLPGVLEAIAAEPIGSLVVTGSPGMHFCAGNDHREFEPDSKFATWGTGVVRDGLRAMEECPILAIAAVEGAVLGSGFMLVSLCDVRLCTRDARFGLPEMRVGAFAGYSVTRRVLPVGVARRLALAGEYLGAERAHGLGYVEDVYGSREEMLDAAESLARDWAGLAGIDVAREAKRIFGTVDGTDLWSGYAVERDLAIRTLAVPRSPAPPRSPATPSTAPTTGGAGAARRVAADAAGDTEGRHDAQR